MKDTVIVRGAGDLATGIIHKLYGAGFNVVALEIAKPTAIRPLVSFSEAVFNKSFEVEGVKAVLCNGKPEIEAAFESGVAVVVDPKMACLDEIKAVALVDATIAKRNMGVHMDLAPIVIGVGPGFTAAKDVHAVVETSRGHDLGRIYYEGRAKENTGMPGPIMGYTGERVLRAPCEGTLEIVVDIKGFCKKGDVVLKVGGTPVLAELDGIVRGMIREGTFVKKGMKIGDIDPRLDQLENCGTISDKARCIAGGVLEAILHLKRG